MDVKKRYELHTDNDLLIELNDFAVDLKKYG
jgi:hypothetical protein